MKPRYLLAILLYAPCVFSQTTVPGQVNSPYLWRQAVGGAVIGVPEVQERSVVMALDGGMVKGYSPSGKQLWSHLVSGRLSPFLARSREGTVYVSRTNGMVMALGNTGAELWRANPGGTPGGPIVIGWDSRVFVPTARKLSCYTASGNLLWSKAFDDKISAGPWLDDAGGIMLSLDNGSALCFDLFGSAVSWRLPSPARTMLSFGHMILTLHDNGDMRHLDRTALDTPPGNVSYRLPASPLAAAAMDGRAAVLLSNGQVVMLSGADGRILWTADSHVRLIQGGPVSQADTSVITGALAGARVIYDERGVYALTASGVTAFTAEGRRLWFTELKNASGVPAFSGDGVLYSGGTDWVLYAWKLEDRTLKTGQSTAGVYGTGNPPPSAYSGVPGRYEESLVKQELESIRREINAGRVGDNELEWLAYLMETASGSSRASVSGFNESRVLVLHRIQALQLLGRIGSSEAIPWLVQFFRRETEPVVKAAAAAAIGGIGVDPDGAAIQEFLSAAKSGNPVRDEQALLAVAAATGSLCRYSGPSVYSAGLLVLNLLDARTMPPAVQRQARREKDSLGIP